VDRGVVLSETGRFAVEELELGEPGQDEVLVRIEASGVCHTDLHVVETGWATRLPAVLGHEGAGVVEAVGPGVDDLSPGDRVLLGWRASCGECEWCRRGATHLCRRPPAARTRPRLADGTEVSGVLRIGSLATRAFAHKAGTVLIDDGLSTEEASLISCSVATGVCSVLKTAQVFEGARVGVIGCGAVGIAVIQGARVAGAGEIYAIDLDERKLETAKRFGATHTGEGVKLDFVFDVVGAPATVEQGLEMLGHAGTLVYVGLPRPGAKAPIPLERLFDRRTRILVSHGGDHVPAEDFPKRGRLAVEGKLELAPMISKRIGLDDVPQAFEDMKRGEVIRSVVTL
jgi:S-(hydroxymethyl)mycothiol dehydrogenase